MKTLQRIIPFFLLLLASHAFAQDLYELKFKDTNNNQYKGLFVVFNDSKIYMRVAYYSENVYRVVQVDYTSGRLDYEGEKCLALIGSNPQFITKKGTYGYNPDHLIFVEGEDIPLLTDTPDDPSSVITPDSFKALTANDITDSYLREFYASQENDYFALKRMFDLDEVANKDNTTEEEKTDNSNITLHLFVVANTSISDIGAGCAIDQRNLEGEFKGISEALGISFQRHFVNGEDFNRPNVVNALNNLTPSSNDIVIFIYRGHGFRWTNQTETWPQMDLRTSNYTRISEQTSMSLGEVYTRIVAKGARLNLILGDCCNNDVGISQNTNNNYLILQSNNNYNDEKLKALFIDAKGNLLSCAASPGEYSWVNSATGGFYTVSFLQALREEISYLRNDTADWKDLIENTMRNAKNKTNSCSNCTPQNGQYYYGIK